jgi:hypothetical protein
MPKVRIRLFKVPERHVDKLPATTRLECRVEPKHPVQDGHSHHSCFTLMLTEAMAYLCSEVGGTIWIREKGVVKHLGPANDPYRTFDDLGVSFAIERTEEGFAIKHLNVGPDVGTRVCDYTDNPGATLVGQMKMDEVELEVDRPRHWYPH